MREKHWLKSYGETPAEINADRYGSVVELLEGTMRHSRRFAVLVHAKLRRCRSDFSRVLCLPAFLSLCGGKAIPTTQLQGLKFDDSGQTAQHPTMSLPERGCPTQPRWKTLAMK
jgi:hypothetical protein